jgi:hypothetical protein
MFQIVLLIFSAAALKNICFFLMAAEKVYYVVENLKYVRFLSVKISKYFIGDIKKGFVLSVLLSLTRLSEERGQC